MKKAMILSTTILMCTNANASGNEQPESSISFTKTSEMIVSSTTALVNITVNATALQDDSSIIQQSAIQRLTSILPKIDWKVIDLKESQADSGAQNIKLVIQARLTDQQIKTLQKELKSNNSSNSRFKVDVISFNPTQDQLNQAKENMMLEMYQSIEQYVDTFNNKTNSHYFIRSINYNADESPFANKAVMSMRTDNAAIEQSSDNNEDNKEIQISKKVNMRAYVTLAQKDVLTSTIKKDVQMKIATVLPPAYLQVEGYNQCLQTQNEGTWTAWCIPKVQPKSCSDDSWKALLKLKVQGKLDGMVNCDWQKTHSS